jgi:hypothetical protein
MKLVHNLKMLKNVRIREEKKQIGLKVTNELGD